MQIDFAAVLDGAALSVRDDLDVRMLGVGGIRRRFQHYGQFVRVEQDQAADRDDADTGHEEFHERGVEGFARFSEHESQDF